MTDSNLSCTLKNSLVKGDRTKVPDSLHRIQFYNNATENIKTGTKKSKGRSDNTLNPNTDDNKEFVPLKANVYTSDLSDQNYFFDLPATSSNELFIVDGNISVPAPNEQSNKCIAEFENSMHISKKSSKISMPSDVSEKYIVDKQGISSNGKNTNSSSFSIFGELLNKRQNDTFTSRNPSTVSKFSMSSSPHLTKHEDFEPKDAVQRNQMKTKLRSMWNNVKYGWRIKREVNLKTESAIWLLGQCYHNKLNDDVALTQDVIEQLRLDLLSKIWLTYRVNFPVIPGTNIVSDSGWGCMLRCGQMMIAQAFVCHFLKRDWRLSSQQSEAKNQLYKTILRWFGDSMSDRSPFSLHHLVSMGENYGRKAGDWYGPTHAAHVLRDALQEAKKHHPLLQQLCMYVASDGIVFKQDVLELCLNSECSSNTSFSSDFATSLSIQCNTSSKMLKDTESSEFLNMSEDRNDEPKSFEATCPSYSEFGPPSYNSSVKPKWKSLILFVSVRLGNDKINPFYVPCLKSLLAYEHCIGIIGGRPKHALYFIGWQDEKIIHMDPHSCQPAVDVEKDDFNEKSFHSSSVRMMSFSEMDPSCSIGFYFRELEDFLFFIEKFSEITAPLKRNLEYPVFALADGKRIDVQDEICHPDGKCISSSSAPYVADGDDDNDYILL